MTVTRSPGRQVREVLVDEEVAVDLGGVALGAAGGGLVVDLVDDDLDAGADAGGEVGGADRLRLGHEALPAVLLDLVGQVAGQGVGAGALDVLVAEAADAVEAGLVQPVEEVLELGLGLAGIADDEGGAEDELGAARRASGRSRRGCGRRRPGGPCDGGPRGWLCWKGMSR